MSGYRTNCELGIYINHRADKPLSLKELLHDQFVDNIIPPKLILTVTIAPHESATLIDDLETCHNIAAKEHNITFVVHAHSTLVYRTKSCCLEKISSCSTMLSKNLTIKLVGYNAKADIQCCCYGINDNVFTYKTVQEHCAPNTTSTLTIKGILNNQSKITSTNMIRIHKNAQQAVAEQTNKNILIGAKARAISIPQLEIHAHDVQCKHGAATSKFDNHQEFYLQSRGFDEKSTQEALIKAFLQ
jgi:Fe-S cluster assembly scaffold protein SufB